MHKKGGARVIMSIAGTFSPARTFAAPRQASEVLPGRSLHPKVLGRGSTVTLQCTGGRRIAVDRFRGSRISELESRVGVAARSRSLYYFTLSRTHLGSAAARSRSEGGSEVGNITVEV